jgi:TPR repeat protein
MLGRAGDENMHFGEKQRALFGDSKARREGSGKEWTLNSLRQQSDPMRPSQSMIAALAAAFAVASSPAIPTVARYLNGLGCVLVARDGFWPAARIFSYVSVFGSVEATNNLGVLRMYGLGTRMNLTEARALFASAMRRGNSVATYNLSIRPHGEDEKDISETRTNLLEALVEQGDVHAAARLGRILQSRSISTGSGPDPERSHELLELAARSGDNDYKLLLADSLLSPIGVVPQTIDTEVVTQLVTEVWEADEPKAAHFIAFEYEWIQKWALDTDLPFAYHDQWGWFKVAADSGNINAICRIGPWAVWKAKGTPTNVTMDEVAQSVPYLEACGSLTMATLFSKRGIFGNPNLYGKKETVDHVPFSGLQGSALRTLSEMYATGFGVPVDTAKSQRYLRQAAKF